MKIKDIPGKIKRKISAGFEVDKALSAKDKKKLAKLPRFTPATIKLFGKNLNIVDAPTFLGSYEEIFKSEVYKFIPAGKKLTIIDCGANIGLSTLYFKINFPGADITAFEPDPNIFKVLKANLLSFGYDDVICKNEAISNRDATLSFWLEGGHSGMIVDNGSAKNSAQVKAIRLKSLLNDYDKITFLKIDIEGEEGKVIPDIAEELHKVDFLFLEYHSFINADQELDSLLNIIKAAGMRYYVESAITKPLPFIRKEIFLKMDTLLNIFCYREQNVDEK